MHPRVKLWLIAIAFSAAACGLFAALSPAHSAEACTSVEVIKKSLTEQGAPLSAMVTLRGAKQVNLYADAVGLVLTNGLKATGLLFVTTPNGVYVAVIEEGDCSRYYFIVPTEAHRHAIGAIMRGA